MFGTHIPELVIILVIALLIFGPKKLPEMGSSIGKSIKEFRKGMNEISHPKEDTSDEIKVPNAEAQKHDFLASQSTSNEQLPNLESNKVESEKTAMFKKMFGNIVLVGYQPTCENLVADFAGRILPLLPSRVKLHSLKLYETATSFAEWFASDNQ